jgi:predicted amino acid racemase
MSGLRKKESNTLVQLPKVECVTKAISDLDGVTNVEYQNITKKRNVHYFRYKWKSVSPTVYFEEQSSGEYRFQHSDLIGVFEKINGLKFKPKVKINEALEIIPKVEAILEKKCAIKIPLGPIENLNS